MGGLVAIVKLDLRHLDASHGLLRFVSVEIGQPLHFSHYNPVKAPIGILKLIMRAEIVPPFSVGMTQVGVFWRLTIIDAVVAFARAIHCLIQSASDKATLSQWRADMILRDTSNDTVDFTAALAGECTILGHPGVVVVF